MLLKQAIEDVTHRLASLRESNQQNDRIDPRAISAKEENADNNH